MLAAEYNTFMDIQQAINLQLMEEFARRGIEFAYPTTKQFTVEPGTGRRPATEARPRSGMRPFANRRCPFIEAYAALRLASPHSHRGDTAL